MEFKIEIWTIQQIIDLYSNDSLNLNPPYQRKFIWSTDDQQTLIDSILHGYAIPNIFLLQRGKKYEMVDGQQRTRTILNFYKHGVTTFEGKHYSEKSFPKFSKYQIPITIITKIEPGETIQEFYSLVNKAGIHLNRPELKRSEYFDTKFLKLVNEMASVESFQNLELFTEASENRLIDTDFVSELIAQLNIGISDKKHSVDKTFENDITDVEYKGLKKEFLSIIKIFSTFNDYYPIKKTRYKQRNDFYTLFGFIKNNIKLKPSTLLHFYKFLCLINEEINPSNQKCEPFQEYSFNCISQSNSKNARQKREDIISSIFINKAEKLNVVQNKIKKAYDLDESKMCKLEGNLTFDIKNISFK
jgi:hypothetical protein